MELALQPVALTVGEVPGLGTVRLRPWRGEDRESVRRAFHDPDIIRWVTQIPEPNDDHVQLWLRTRDQGWANGSLATWAVTGSPDGSPASSQSVLGAVGLKRLDYARRMSPQAHAGVMYWMLPASRGHGLAATVAAFAARWAWTAYRLHRVELHHEVTNVASCRVAERAGYELEGTLRRSYWTPGGWVDEHIHALLSPGPAGAIPAP